MDLRPTMRNRGLEPTDQAKPSETSGLPGTGLGLARQESAGLVFEWVWNRPDWFLWPKPGLLAGYQDPLLTFHIPDADCNGRGRTQVTEMLQD
jgi:hypothetical protein